MPCGPSPHEMPRGTATSRRVGIAWQQLRASAALLIGVAGGAARAYVAKGALASVASLAMMLGGVVVVADAALAVLSTDEAQAEIIADEERLFDRDLIRSYTIEEYESEMPAVQADS